MKRNNKLVAGMIMGVIVTLMLGACTPKNITYMQDLNENVTIQTAEHNNIKIRPEDKISIVVHSKSPELAALFNLPVVANNMRNINTAQTSGSGAAVRTYSSSDGMSTYTVSPEGNIAFPVLGTLHVAGMTRYELAGFIKGELMGRKLINDPTVVVEFMNTGISILGEVNRPGRYDMNRDNITLVEALALAGDLSINGVRETVKVIREDTDGTTKVYVVDMTDGTGMLKSPAYYLQQNDVVYVEPNDKRKRDTTVNGNTALSASFWISAASFIASLATLIVNLAK